MPKTTQDKVLDYIESHLGQHQIPPTLRDIQEHFGFSAIGTVQYHLKNLSEAGFLEIRPRLSRGITLTAKALGIPILGHVPAGPAQLAFQELEGYLPAAVLDQQPVTLAPDSSGGIGSGPGSDARGLYALRVKGDSMIEAGILNGDLI